MPKDERGPSPCTGAGVFPWRRAATIETTETIKTTVSDEDAVCAVHARALAQGEGPGRAWRAAVGAYLERHPSVGVVLAERIVSVLVRRGGGADPIPGIGMGHPVTG